MHYYQRGTNHKQQPWNNNNCFKNYRKKYPRPSAESYTNSRGSYPCDSRFRPRYPNYQRGRNSLYLNDVYYGATRTTYRDNYTPWRGARGHGGTRGHWRKPFVAAEERVIMNDASEENDPEHFEPINIEVESPCSSQQRCPSLCTNRIVQFPFSDYNLSLTKKNDASNESETIRLLGMNKDCINVKLEEEIVTLDAEASKKIKEECIDVNMDEEIAFMEADRKLMGNEDSFHVKLENDIIIIEDVDSYFPEIEEQCIDIKMEEDALREMSALMPDELELIASELQIDGGLNFQTYEEKAIDINEDDLHHSIDIKDDPDFNVDVVSMENHSITINSTEENDIEEHLMKKWNSLEVKNLRPTFIHYLTLLQGESDNLKSIHPNIETDLNNLLLDHWPFAAFANLRKHFKGRGIVLSVISTLFKQFLIKQKLSNDNDFALIRRITNSRRLTRSTSMVNLQPSSAAASIELQPLKYDLVEVDLMKPTRARRNSISTHVNPPKLIYFPEYAEKINSKCSNHSEVDEIYAKIVDPRIKKKLFPESVETVKLGVDDDSSNSITTENHQEDKFSKADDKEISSKRNSSEMHEIENMVAKKRKSDESVKDLDENGNECKMRQTDPKNVSKNIKMNLINRSHSSESKSIHKFATSKRRFSTKDCEQTSSKSEVHSPKEPSKHTEPKRFKLDESPKKPQDSVKKDYNLEKKTARFSDDSKKPLRSGESPKSNRDFQKELSNFEFFQDGVLKYTDSQKHHHKRSTSAFKRRTSFRSHRRISDTMSETMKDIYSNLEVTSSTYSPPERHSLKLNLARSLGRNPKNDEASVQIRSPGRTEEVFSKEEKTSTVSSKDLKINSKCEKKTSNDFKSDNNKDTVTKEMKKVDCNGYNENSNSEKEDRKRRDFNAVNKDFTFGKRDMKRGNYTTANKDWNSENKDLKKGQFNVENNYIRKSDLKIQNANIDTKKGVFNAEKKQSRYKPKVSEDLRKSHENLKDPDWNSNIKDTKKRHFNGEQEISYKLKTGDQINIAEDSNTGQEVIKNNQEKLPVDHKVQETIPSTKNSKKMDVKKTDMHYKKKAIEELKFQGANSTKPKTDENINVKGESMEKEMCETAIKLNVQVNNELRIPNKSKDAKINEDNNNKSVNTVINKPINKNVKHVKTNVDHSADINKNEAANETTSEDMKNGNSSDPRSMFEHEITSKNEPVLDGNCKKLLDAEGKMLKPNQFCEAVVLIEVNSALEKKIAEEAKALSESNKHLHRENEDADSPRNKSSAEFEIPEALKIMNSELEKLFNEGSSVDIEKSSKEQSEDAKENTKNLDKRKSNKEERNNKNNGEEFFSVIKSNAKETHVNYKTKDLSVAKATGIEKEANRSDEDICSVIKSKEGVKCRDQVAGKRSMPLLCTTSLKTIDQLFPTRNSSEILTVTVLNDETEIETTYIDIASSPNPPPNIEIVNHEETVDPNVIHLAAPQQLKIVDDTNAMIKDVVPVTNVALNGNASISVETTAMDVQGTVPSYPVVSAMEQSCGRSRPHPGTKDNWLQSRGVIVSSTPDKPRKPVISVSNIQSMLRNNLLKENAPDVGSDPPVQVPAAPSRIMKSMVIDRSTEVTTQPIRLPWSQRQVPTHSSSVLQNILLKENTSVVGTDLPVQVSKEPLRSMEPMVVGRNASVTTQAIRKAPRQQPPAYPAPRVIIPKTRVINQSTIPRSQENATHLCGHTSSTRAVRNQDLSPSQLQLTNPGPLTVVTKPPVGIQDLPPNQQLAKKNSRSEELVPNRLINNENARAPEQVLPIRRYSMAGFLQLLIPMFKVFIDHVKARGQYEGPDASVALYFHNSVTLSVLKGIMTTIDSLYVYDFKGQLFVDAIKKIDDQFFYLTVFQENARRAKTNFGKVFMEFVNYLCIHLQKRDAIRYETAKCLLSPMTYDQRVNLFAQIVKYRSLCTLPPAVPNGPGVAQEMFTCLCGKTAHLLCVCTRIAFCSEACHRKTLPVHKPQSICVQASQHT